MPIRLCSICQSIPPKFWCRSYDLKEYSGEIFVKLQTMGDMEIAKAKGCQLCTILLDSPKFFRGKSIDDYLIQGKKEMLYLRRSLGYPDRAVELGVGPKGSRHISRTFFYRVPEEWCQLNRRANGLQVKSIKTSALKPMSMNEAVNNIELMKNWLHVCREEHTECSKYRLSFLPTRLLDVQAFGRGPDIRLVEGRFLTSDLYTPPTYLTLSHCWGKSNLITTTKENFASRMDRILFCDLSQTFRDAVNLTRELGQRYLWIDSLCIIQDDVEDWSKEAATMAQVYGGSYCTLAALSSADGRGGCRREVDIQKSMSNTFFDLRDTSSPGEPYIRIFCKEPTDWQTDYDGLAGQKGEMQSPLRHRAWVLQEKEMSRRSIHFGKNQLLWECREMRGSAQLPWFEMKKKKGLTYPDGWPQLVEDYSIRALTKFVDKLPALSGLARQHQEPNSSYLAGIWSNQLPAALMWQSMEPLSKRHEAYTAPSWSWASLQGRISYDSQRLTPPYEDYSDPRDSPPRIWSNVFQCLKLEEAVVKPKYPESPYGIVEEGAYLIFSSAYLLEIDVPAEIPLSQQQVPKKSSEPLTKDYKQVGVFYRDTTTDNVKAKRAFLFVLQKEPLYPLSEHPFQQHQSMDMVDTVMGIVVVLTTKHKDAFRRIGLARWVDEGLLEQVEPQTIKIV